MLIDLLEDGKLTPMKLHIALKKEIARNLTLAEKVLQHKFKKGME